MKTINLDSLHCFIEIVDGVFEEGNSIIVEYYLNYSNCDLESMEWRTTLLKNQSKNTKRTLKDENVITKQSNDHQNTNIVSRETSKKSSKSKQVTVNDIHGCTRKSIRDSNNQCTFNHLFELNLEFNKQLNSETTSLDRNKNDLKRNDLKKNDLNKNDLNKNSDQSFNETGVNELNENDDRIENLDNSSDLNSKNQIDKEPLRSDWPFFELRVWSIDQWKRKKFIGLAFLDLPHKPGQYVEIIDIWTLNSNRSKTKLMQYFLGYSLEPTSKLKDKTNWRLSLNGQTIGCITIKLNLILCKRIPTQLESEELDAIEDKIQKVLVAFRDAQKRLQKMQNLLKDKENTEI